jgi:hypothetical protein
MVRSLAGLSDLPYGEGSFGERAGDDGPEPGDFGVLLPFPPKRDPLC